MCGAGSRFPSPQQRSWSDGSRSPRYLAINCGQLRSLNAPLWLGPCSGRNASRALVRWRFASHVSRKTSCSPHTQWLRCGKRSAWPHDHRRRLSGCSSLAARPLGRPPTGPTPTVAGLLRGPACCVKTTAVEKNDRKTARRLKATSDDATKEAARATWTPAGFVTGGRARLTEGADAGQEPRTLSERRPDCRSSSQRPSWAMTGRAHECCRPV